MKFLCTIRNIQDKQYLACSLNSANLYYIKNCKL